MRTSSLVVLLVPVVLGGCASGLGGGDYERVESRRVYEVKMGVVESVREVKLEGTDTGVGATAGGVVGGIAGSTAGEGKGSAIAAVLGAVVGGIAGSAAEELATRKPGLEIVVRLDSGRVVAVVQEKGNDTFASGDRVKLLESGGQVRVTR